MASIDDAPATVVERAGAPERGPRSDPDALPRGTTIGRYVVIDRIGAGGMGAVYSAYDAALHRRVALKLLRSPGIEQERLLAEARTMAQLAHPAIVAVHDVGEFEGQVFIAMELVEGATLRRWQAKHRPWRELVGLYATIADALVYAHERGVIHRDFKPDNVIVDPGDRPRVTDFGLAKIDPNADPSPASSLITKHTISGTGAGTPGYMSPEQRMGDPTDASTDQYAFCVSLFEALYGWLPVDHDGSERADLPRELVAAIRRGMADTPAQRWPSMRELAAVLAPAKRSARWPWLVGAAVVVAAAAVSFVLLRKPTASSCGGQSAIDSAWGSSRRDEVRAGFAAAAPDISAVPVITALDTWSDRWREMSVGSCHATEAGAQSQQLGDLRAGCLAHKLDEVEALVRVIAKPDRQVALHAGRASLPELAACADAAGLIGRPDLPADPVKRFGIAQLEAQLDDALALYRVGKFETALDMARPVVVQAERIGYLPLLGKAHGMIARLEFSRSVDFDTSESASMLALAEQPWRHDESMGVEWVNLVWIVGEVRHRPKEAIAMAQLAQAEADRAGSQSLQAVLTFRIGVMQENLKQWDQAQASFERSLALSVAIHDQGGVVAALCREAAVATSRGDVARSLELTAQALVEADKLDEPARDDHAIALQNAGDRYVELGRLAEGVAALRKGLAVAGDPRDFPDAVTSLRLDLGEALRRQGDLAAAESETREALAIVDRYLDPNGVTAVKLLSNLGTVQRQRGEYRDAEASIRRALTTLRAVPKDAPNADDYMGETTMLYKLSQIQLAAGDSASAVASAEQALEVGQREVIDSYFYGVVRHALARALWANGQHDRARKTMHQAALDYHLAGDAAGQAEAEHWLRDAH